jgi:hypothetical protein
MALYKPRVLNGQQPARVGYVGPGHARHALDGRETMAVCGAVESVTRRTGRRPMINHTDPYDPEKVTCKRCRKRLGLNDA